MQLNKIVVLYYVCEQKPQNKLCMNILLRYKMLNSNVYGIMGTVGHRNGLLIYCGIGYESYDAAPYFNPYCVCFDLCLLILLFVLNHGLQIVCGRFAKFFLAHRGISEEVTNKLKGKCKSCYSTTL